MFDPRRLIILPSRPLATHSLPGNMLGSWGALQSVEMMKTTINAFKCKKKQWIIRDVCRWTCPFYKTARPTGEGQYECGQE